MSKINELIVAGVLPLIKRVGKLELEHVLSGIKEHNSEEVYKNTLQSLHSNFSLLKEAAYKSKSKVDDGIVDLVLEAVNENANAEGIVLS